MANSNLTATSMDSASGPARALPIGSAPPAAPFAARLAAVPTISATQGIQPVGRPVATLRHEVEAGHDFEASHADRERVRLPAKLTVVGGQLHAGDLHTTKTQQVRRIVWAI